ncbi:glucosyl transferase [Pantoea agglomerans]|uniref:glucosyl transferase n=1 Tax=Enterobacter agglomerans TaxID=549 RepID=UPI0016548844|nr:glucosyl transferase [Pantoea agglomerans]
MLFMENRLNKTQILLILVVLLAIMITRRPDIFNHPQLWAEDGKAFLQSVWNVGAFDSLITPRDGYFQTLPKLTMSLASFLGVSSSAVTALAAAVTLRCLFLVYVLSGRMSFVNIKYRIVFCFYFVLQPNIQEAYINITNAHTYVAIYLLCIMISKPPVGVLWKCHDFIILVICGLSGPFIGILAPCLALKRITEHGSIINAIKKFNFFDVVFTLCFLAQCAAIATFSADRTSAPLGASWDLFASILSYKIILGSLIDLQYVRWMWGENILNMTICAFIIASSLFYFFKCGWQYKVVFTYVTIIVGLSIFKPVINNLSEQWPLFEIPIVGCRYFIASGMAIFCLLLIISHNISIKYPLANFLFILLVIPCLIASYRMPKLQKVGYEEDVKKFESARKGDIVNIRTNPPGWSMDLIKK